MDNKKINISELLKMPENQFHPLVYVGGNPKVGKNVYVGLFSEINANKAEVIIGDNCDIASFVSINAADSHKKAIGLADEIERKNIKIGNNVFIGSHCFIGGGVTIGNNSVIGAGTIISKPCVIEPYSLVAGNPPVIKQGFYKNEKNNTAQ
ncbi:MAG: acyltransferase [Candidatus Pacebacteria bacterium]|nr:acyltransferase [Candidatus Paceibacterota bacterium]